MDLRIKNKLVLVTGSTLGIGKAIAAKLLQEGALVIINGRSQERVDAVIHELQPIGKIYGVAADTARYNVIELTGASNSLKRPSQSAQSSVRCSEQLGNPTSHTTPTG
jgi:NADP-dependent 3-hydroxy acid dehydrogenase YdfG